jgi:CRISPR-associated protein Csb2
MEYCREAHAESCKDQRFGFVSTSCLAPQTNLRILSLDGRYELPCERLVLRVGEAIHRAWVARVAGGEQIDAPELTGQGRFGQPLGGRHEHSHLFPVDINGDGLIDHVVVYVPMGMRPNVLAGLQGLRVIYGKGGKPWFGLREVSQNDGGVLASGVEWLCSVEGGAREWVSWSPFVAPRHVKRGGRNTLGGQVRAELEGRGYLVSEDELRVVELGRVMGGGSGYELSRIEGRVRPPARVGYGIRLEFREAVKGPIAIGYGSHFGLGLFRAVG